MIENISDNSSALTDEESRQAEAILDALIRGNITTNGNGDQASSTDDSGFCEDLSAMIAQDQQQQQLLSSSKATFNGISNISEIITEDGQKIVIVIANDLPAQTPTAPTAQIEELPPTPPPQVVTYRPTESDVAVATFGSSGEELDPSDVEWLPSPRAAAAPAKKHRKTAASALSKPAVAKGKVQKRGPYKRSTHSNIKDKKERKKMQNVEAARRYR